MKVKYMGRDVDISIDGATYDYDYHCDAYMDGAMWEDTGIELTEEEIDVINDYMHSGAVNWITDWVY